MNEPVDFAQPRHRMKASERRDAKLSHGGSALLLEAVHNRAENLSQSAPEIDPSMTVAQHAIAHDADEVDPFWIPGEVKPPTTPEGIETRRKADETADHYERLGDELAIWAELIKDNYYKRAKAIRKEGNEFAQHLEAEQVRVNQWEKDIEK